jgi:hypothetical protein
MGDDLVVTGERQGHNPHHIHPSRAGIAGAEACRRSSEGKLEGNVAGVLFIDPPIAAGGLVVVSGDLGGGPDHVGPGWEVVKTIDLDVEGWVAPDGVDLVVID